MKKVIYSQPMRILAFILAVISLPLAVGLTVAAAWNIENSFSAYGAPRRVVREQLQQLLSSYPRQIMDQELYDPGAVQANRGYPNLRFTAVLDGVVLESTEQGDETVSFQQSFDLAQYYGLHDMQSVAEFVQTVPAAAGLYRVESEINIYKVIPEDAVLAQELDLLYKAEAAPVETAEGATAVSEDESPAETEEISDGAVMANGIDGAGAENGLTGGAENGLTGGAENGLTGGTAYPGEETPYQAGDLRMTVRVSLPEELQPGDIFAGCAGFLNALLDAGDWFIPLAALGYLLALVGLLLSFCAAGHLDGSEKAVPTRLCDFPLEVLLILFGGLALLALVGVAGLLDTLHPNIFEDLFDTVLVVVGAAFCLFAAETFALGCLLNLAVRFKCGIFWKNCLLWRLLRWLGGLIGRVFRLCGATLRSLPVLGRAVFWLAGIWLGSTAYLILSVENRSPGMLLLHRILAAAAGIGVAVWITAGAKDLQTAIRRMAAGDLDTPVRTDRLHGFLREIGRDLTRIKEGVNLQVQERMKSEHLKTELIANVSHDIKTPLTSIINYVDLMKKQPPQDATQQGYLEVLDRQSTRLKKLIEDLTEASKASSGVLPTHPEPCDTAVLLQQVLGEYEERLEKAGLTPVVSLAGEPLTVLADGRHLWRILDNLLNNICKYAQSGTRVYMELTRQGEQAVFTFRNISREQLNITGEELMERFVRGDRSRHTEGSGLGLSIARSLTELQNGTLHLAIDGDLFKATVSFPLQKT